MLKIRLSRVGKKNSPIFRLVIAEKSRAVKRENIEILGLYNPTLSENKFQAHKERVLFWIGKGAQPSDTANNLLCDFGILPKNQKIKNTFAKPQKKKDMKAEKENKPVSTVKEAGEVKEDKEGKEEPTAETTATGEAKEVPAEIGAEEIVEPVTEATESEAVEEVPAEESKAR